jgi:hypothetical protein
MALDMGTGVTQRIRIASLVVAVVVAPLVLAACGSSAPDLTKMSSGAILKLAIHDASSQSNISSTVSTPTTLTYEIENSHADVKGYSTSRYGEFWAVQIAPVTQRATYYLEFNDSYVTSNVRTSVSNGSSAVQRELALAAEALGGHWFTGSSLAVDPQAVAVAERAFANSPRETEAELFNVLADQNMTRGVLTHFDSVAVIPLTIGNTGEVLFVSANGDPLPVGASLPLGANTSPVIFRFKWPSSATITAPPTVVTACELASSSPASLPGLRLVAGGSLYDRCPK